MGGRGARFYPSGRGQTRIKKMKFGGGNTLDQLRATRARQAKELEALAKRGGTIFDLHDPNYDAQLHTEYVTLRRDISETDSLISQAAKEEISQKKRRKKKNVNTKKTFVNGYGEATHRYITSGTYERAQKRQKKEIDDMFKNRR